MIVPPAICLLNVLYLPFPDFLDGVEATLKSEVSEEQLLVFAGEIRQHVSNDPSYAIGDTPEISGSLRESAPAGMKSRYPAYHQLWEDHLSITYGPRKSQWASWFRMLL